MRKVGEFVSVVGRPEVQPLGNRLLGMRHKTERARVEVLDDVPHIGTIVGGAVRRRFKGVMETKTGDTRGPAIGAEVVPELVDGSFQVGGLNRCRRHSGSVELHEQISGLSARVN